MAICIKSGCLHPALAKYHEFVKAWIEQRFLASRPKSLAAKRPAHLKCTKPSFMPNSCLEPRTYKYNLTANFHHLTSNVLIYNVAYFPNMTLFAKHDKVPTSEKHWDYGYKEVYINDRFEQEMSKLRRRGAMKDIPLKIPEGIKAMGAPPKD